MGEPYSESIRVSRELVCRYRDTLYLFSRLHREERQSKANRLPKQQPEGWTLNCDGSRELLAAAVPVVLVEFAVKSLAPDAERACGVSFVAPGVIERRFNGLALNLVHR